MNKLYQNFSKSNSKEWEENICKEIQNKNAEIFWLPAMFLFIGLMGLLATFFPNSLLGISMNTQGSGERFCLHCFKKISSWATTCPYCHKKQHSST